MKAAASPAASSQPLLVPTGVASGGFARPVVLSLCGLKKKVILSRERSHIPPGEKENHLQKCLLREYVTVVPRRVILLMVQKSG